MSPRGAVWYKREPRAFLEGVRQMPEREVAVYAVVLDLIYDAGHQTLNDPKHIASYFSDLGAAAVRRSIDWLVSAGKLEIDGDFLTNKRAKNEGKTREELRKTRRNSGHLGGVSSANSRSKSNGHNGLGEAFASDELPLDKIREEKEEEAKASLSETVVSDRPKPSRKKGVYTPEFEQAWASYPTDPMMSKKTAFAAWVKLDVEDQGRVQAAIPAFVAYCRKNPDYRPVHMNRFITDRRFDGLLAEKGGSQTGAPDWSKRLAYARQHQRWSTPEWGPMPSLAGCLAPREMIEPGDGVGWAEWSRNAS